MKIIQIFLQILFPNKCLSCQKIISFDANFCADCWQNLEFIKQPNCRICAYPFEFVVSDKDSVCATCLKKPPFFDKTITIFRYNDTIGRAISNFKYRDQTHLAKNFAKILQKNANTEIDDCDIICAVPLHKNKLSKRLFNQSILIASHLDKSKLIRNLVFRVKDQKSQVNLTQKQRVKNLKKAFVINSKYKKSLENKAIVLIDDVITTSTTINSVAKVLKKNGAKKVVVLTIAKTVFY